MLKVLRARGASPCPVRGKWTVGVGRPAYLSAVVLTSPVHAAHVFASPDSWARAYHSCRPCVADPPERPEHAADACAPPVSWLGCLES